MCSILQNGLVQMTFSKQLVAIWLSTVTLLMGGVYFKSVIKCYFSTQKTKLIQYPSLTNE